MAGKQSTGMLVSMKEPLRVLSLELLGGHPILDFVNTLDWRDRDAEAGGPVETLVSYEALLAWAQRLALLEAGEARLLAKEAQANPAAANAVLQDALALREALHRLIIAAEARQRPASADLDRLNHWLAAVPTTLRLATNTDGYVWMRSQAASGLHVPLVRLAHMAAELLTSGQVQRVHRCAGPGCGWLFLDTSPNRRRRWCSMEGCGNRAKAKRHYQKLRLQP